MPYIHPDMSATSIVTAGDDVRRELVEHAAAALGKPYDFACQHAQQKVEAAKVDENGVEYCSSRPPTPPSSGTNTPTLRIAPCPLRLCSLVPPPQYGVVEDYTIFRSSYPQDRNMSFIKTLPIKSILTLVDSEPTPGFVQWLDESKIIYGKVTITPNKEAKEGKEASATSVDSICEALLFVMDGSNYPLWIHCNQGRHRTGCVVACLRKIQGMPIEEILKEYIAYADPKPRPGDIELIKAFDPHAVFTYAKQTGFIGGEDPKFTPVVPTPITNVYELALELAKSGRQDSVAAEETEEVLENLSSTMSDISLGEQTDPIEDMSITPISSNVSPTAIIEQVNNIDPRLLESGENPHPYVDLGVQVVERDDESIDHIA